MKTNSTPAVSKSYFFISSHTLITPSIIALQSPITIRQRISEVSFITKIYFKKPKKKVHTHEADTTAIDKATLFYYFLFMTKEKPPNNKAIGKKLAVVICIFYCSSATKCLQSTIDKEWKIVSFFERSVR